MTAVVKINSFFMKTSPFVINDKKQIHRSVDVIIHHHAKGRLALS